MRSKIARIATLVVIAMLISSCGFVIRQFSFTRTILTSTDGACTPTSCTNLRLQLRKITNTLDIDGHIFVIMGYNEGADPRQGPLFTDDSGTFFETHEAVRDDGLRAIAKQDGECILPGGDLAGASGGFDSFNAYRTSAAVDVSKGDASDPIFFKHGLKANEFGEHDPGDEVVSLVLAVAGVWVDSTDTGTPGVVDSGEIICMSSVWTSLIYQQS